MVDEKVSELWRRRPPWESARMTLAPIFGSGGGLCRLNAPFILSISTVRHCTPGTVLSIGNFAAVGDAMGEDGCGEVFLGLISV